MQIEEQIIDIFPKLIHVFIQDCGAYKHNNVRIVLDKKFFQKKILDNYLSTYTFVICRILK